MVEAIIIELEERKGGIIPPFNIGLNCSTVLLKGIPLDKKKRSISIPIILIPNNGKRDYYLNR